MEAIFQAKDIIIVLEWQDLVSVLGFLEALYFICVWLYQHLSLCFFLKVLHQNLFQPNSKLAPYVGLYDGLY